MFVKFKPKCSSNKNQLASLQDISHLPNTINIPATALCIHYWFMHEYGSSFSTVSYFLVIQWMNSLVECRNFSFYMCASYQRIKTDLQGQQNIISIFPSLRLYQGQKHVMISYQILPKYDHEITFILLCLDYKTYLISQMIPFQ